MVLGMKPKENKQQNCKNKYLIGGTQYQKKKETTGKLRKFYYEWKKLKDEEIFFVFLLAYPILQHIFMHFT